MVSSLFFKKMIKIRKEIMDEIIKHCKEEYPNEACGIIAGENFEAKKIYRMKNIEESSVSFFMDPKEQLYVMKDIRKNNLEMIGIYHSHPFSLPYPSEKDISLAFYPEASYIIISLLDFNGPVVKSYKIREGKIEEEILLED
jgi:proteasome lid subunit RPN8/RPN11